MINFDGVTQNHIDLINSSLLLRTLKKVGFFGSDNVIKKICLNNYERKKRTKIISENIVFALYNNHLPFEQQQPKQGKT
jgi:hypothetical protein